MLNRLIVLFISVLILFQSSLMAEEKKTNYLNLVLKAKRSGDIAQMRGAIREIRKLLKIKGINRKKKKIIYILVAGLKTSIYKEIQKRVEKLTPKDEDKIDELFVLIFSNSLRSDKRIKLITLMGIKIPLNAKIHEKYLSMFKGSHVKKKAAGDFFNAYRDLVEKELQTEEFWLKLGDFGLENRIHPDKIIYAYKEVLKLNPNNTKAKESLAEISNPKGE